MTEAAVQLGPRVNECDVFVSAPAVEERPGDDLLDRQALHRKLNLTDSKSFAHCLRVERRRSERYRKPCLLVLVEFGHLYLNGERAETIRQISQALSAATRETDLAGWYQEGAAIGVIFTEIEPGASTRERILERLRGSLQQYVNPSISPQLRLQHHCFPEPQQFENEALLDSVFSWRRSGSAAGCRHRAEDLERPRSTRHAYTAPATPRDRLTHR